MTAAKRRTRKPAHAPGKKPADTRPLRIIGGQWRGRKLSFPAIEGLRPTGDRIRETLFNWLTPYLPEARCLDLFAGSGALGFETLSRGASETWLLEQDPHAASVLKQNLATLGAETGKVVEGDSLQWLAHKAGTPFDIVFLDPPFQADLWQRSIDTLDTRGWLADGAAVYIESEPNTPIHTPSRWQLHRDKTSGQVRYRLYFVER